MMNMKMKLLLVFLVVVIFQHNLSTAKRITTKRNGSSINCNLFCNLNSACTACLSCIANMNCPNCAQAVVPAGNCNPNCNNGNYNLANPCGFNPSANNNINNNACNNCDNPICADCWANAITIFNNWSTCPMKPFNNNGGCANIGECGIPSGSIASPNGICTFCDIGAFSIIPPCGGI